MNEIILVLLLIYVIVREYLNYKQVTKLQELIKADTLSEYQSSTGNHVWGRPHGEENQLMEAPNEIAIDDPEFDIRKVTQVTVENEEKPVSIV